MVVLRNFWTPCFWYNDVYDAIMPIALYTGLGSVILVTYTSYILAGGESSQYYMPYFETDARNSMKYVGGICLAYFLLLILFSYFLVRGVRVENRGLILPWLFSMGIIILYQVVYTIWTLFTYYIYLETVFLMICIMLLMSYNIYCWLCVYSVYQIIKERQEPNIVLIYP